MPLYTYRCPRCGHTVDETHTIADRDRVPLCLECSDYDDLVQFGERTAMMVRVPTCASFEIKGFNAKNGYSK